MLRTKSPTTARTADAATLRRASSERVTSCLPVRVPQSGTLAGQPHRPLTSTKTNPNREAPAMLTTYSTRNEAIQHEIIQPLEANGEHTSCYDVQSIADELILDWGHGYAQPSHPDEFYAVVARHAVCDANCRRHILG